MEGRRRRTALLVAGLALMAAPACATTHGRAATTGATSGGEVAPASATLPDVSAAMPLIDDLRNAVPQVTRHQAVVGVGALLALAQARMTHAEYTTMLNALPGGSALLAAAQQSNLPTGADLSSGASGTAVLSQAGLPASLGAQLIPALGAAISARGGPEVANALLEAVK